MRNLAVTARAACTLVLTLMAAALVHAQGVQTSSIVGTVVDASGAVIPNAQVTLRGDALIGGPRAIEADAAGRYRFVALLPGVYEVSVVRAGFAPDLRAGIDVPVGATLTVDLILRPAQVSSQVTVREAWTADVTSAAVSAHLDRPLLENLPSSRSIAGLINLTPGVSNDIGFGGSQSSNALYVDGVDITDPSLQGPWLRLNYNWLERVEVTALGASAEYGETTGVFSNAVIRSGGNRFDLLADYWMTQPSWVGRNTTSLSERLQRQFSPMRVVSWWDTGLQAGGPIRKDRLWFFAGAQALHHEHRPAGYNGPGSTLMTDRRALVKLTGAPSTSLRLEGFVQRGHYDLDGEGLGRFTPVEAAWETRQPQTMWNARVTWTLGPRTLLEVRNGGYDSDQITNPERRDGPPARFDFFTGRESVNAYHWFDENRVQHTTVATMSHHLPGVFGRHDLRVGLEHERADSRSALGLPGKMWFQDFNGSPDSVYLWDGAASTVSSRRTALYARDEWEIASRLTLNIGLRVDMNRASLPLIGEAVGTQPISPRFGAAWDLFGSHRLIARAHVGRSYDPVFHMRVGSADLSESTPLLYALVLGPGQFQVLPGQGLSQTFTIDPELKQSYVNQALAGLEWQASEWLSVQGHYIRRRFERFMGVLDIGSRWIPTQRQDPGPDGRAGTADDGPMLQLFNREAGSLVAHYYSNPADAWRSYDAMQVVTRLRERWNSQVHASYTWSRTQGNVGNGFHANAAARGELSLDVAFSNPNRRLNFEGRAPFDPTHELKVLGTTTLPVWGSVTVGGVYRYVSGPTWTRRAPIRLAHGPERVLAEPRGSRRLPATNGVDLRVEKLFRTPGRSGRLGVYADVFNVTNQGIPTEVVWDSGASFGQPRMWLDPRTLRMGIRVTF